MRRGDEAARGLQEGGPVKERPILFSAPMVRAILKGGKTQTRRVVKPQPVMKDGHWAYWQRGVFSTPYWKNNAGDVQWPTEKQVIDKFIGCPYGQPGDRLWIRETWAPRSNGRMLLEQIQQPFFAATDGEGDIRKPTGWRWRPSIHMPRWASRLSLEVTEVRAERLQDITPDDASAEGIWEFSAKLRDESCKWRDCPSALQQARVAAFRELWESINGAASWAANPWVWVVSLRKVA